VGYHSIFIKVGNDKYHKSENLTGKIFGELSNVSKLTNLNDSSSCSQGALVVHTAVTYSYGSLRDSFE